MCLHVGCVITDTFHSWWKKCPWKVRLTRKTCTTHTIRYLLVIIIEDSWKDQNNHKRLRKQLFSFVPYCYFVLTWTKPLRWKIDPCWPYTFLLLFKTQDGERKSENEDGMGNPFFPRRLTSLSCDCVPVWLVKDCTFISIFNIYSPTSMVLIKVPHPSMFPRHVHLFDVPVWESSAEPLI
jgi:hypothetical protein